MIYRQNNVSELIPAKNKIYFNTVKLIFFSVSFSVCQEQILVGDLSSEVHCVPSLRDKYKKMMFTLRYKVFHFLEQEQDIPMSGKLCKPNLD